MGITVFKMVSLKFSMEIAYGHSYKIKESPTYNDNEIVGPICVYMVNNEKK